MVSLFTGALVTTQLILSRIILCATKVGLTVNATRTKAFLTFIDLATERYSSTIRKSEVYKRPNI